MLGFFTSLNKLQNWSHVVAKCTSGRLKKMREMSWRRTPKIMGNKIKTELGCRVWLLQKWHLRISDDISFWHFRGDDNVMVNGCNNAVNVVNGDVMEMEML